MEEEDYNQSEKSRSSSIIKPKNNLSGNRKHKRKATDDFDNIRENVTSGTTKSEESSFADFCLDERILKVIGELGWQRPTQVQEKMIPLVLEAKNVMARARTGSGKTAAFMLPILQKIISLSSMSGESGLQGPFALFVAPTKELSSQIYKLIVQLTAAFPFIESVNLTDIDPKVEDAWIKNNPDLLVSTPTRLVEALKHTPQLLSEIRHLVLDEADLLLSYGCKDDMKKIKGFLPPQHQTIFTSATLSEDVGSLKEMFMKGTVATLKLKESQLPDASQLAQYHICCQNDEEKYAILLSMIKLKLLIGKSIIFVSSTNRCYQLGLFLQSFEIRSCILNSEMPANSRCHIVDEFNEGRYNYVIASDINDINDSVYDEEDNFGSGESSTKKHPAKRKRIKPMDKESGVARGIDFHHVSNVINFDFPSSFDGYVHRVGRTARGWNKGSAISFVSSCEMSCFEEIKEKISNQLNCIAIVPYEIRIKELDSFVLRTREALAACTKTAVREARLAEIRAEVLRSKKLEGYFAKNPREKAALEHDKKLHTLSLHSPAIADVPDYIVPPALRGQKDFGATQRSLKRRGGKRLKGRKTFNQLRYKRKMEDPLQSFSI